MARMTRDQITETIQVWPSGRSYAYQGDPDGPAGQKRLKAGHYQARLQCPANCRRVYLDLLEPEERARFDQDETSFPGMGRYVAPLPSSDARPWYRGPICPTCGGDGYTPNPKRNPWRRGLPAEWREIRISQRAERIGQESILRCQSSLIDDLLQLAGEGDRSDLARAFENDQVENLYQDPSDWDADQVREYAEEHGVELPEVPTISCPNCSSAEIQTPCTVVGCTLGETPDLVADEVDSRGGWLTEAREACAEHSHENPAEVFEWWLVDSWLCGQLREIGEVVIDNEYGEWWGRCTTGQQWIMDGVLQRIAATREDK